MQQLLPYLIILLTGCSAGHFAPDGAVGPDEYDGEVATDAGPFAEDAVVDVDAGVDAGEDAGVLPCDPTTLASALPGMDVPTGQDVTARFHFGWRFEVTRTIEVSAVGYRGLASGLTRYQIMRTVMRGPLGDDVVRTGMQVQDVTEVDDVTFAFPGGPENPRPVLEPGWYAIVFAGMEGTFARATMGGVPLHEGSWPPPFIYDFDNNSLSDQPHEMRAFVLGCAR